MEESTVDRVPARESSQLLVVAYSLRLTHGNGEYEHDPEFTKSVNSHQHHDTDDHEINELFPESIKAVVNRFRGAILTREAGPPL